MDGEDGVDGVVRLNMGDMGLLELDCLEECDDVPWFQLGIQSGNDKEREGGGMWLGEGRMRQVQRTGAGPWWREGGVGGRRVWSTVFAALGAGLGAGAGRGWEGEEEVNDNGQQVGEVEDRREEVVDVG